MDRLIFSLFLQWTEEKLGNAKITLQTEDFQRLEVETERKRVAYEKLHASTVLLQSQLVKRKISPEDNKSKRLPNDMVGVCMTNYGNEFTDDAALGKEPKKREIRGGEEVIPVNNLYLFSFFRCCQY